MKSTGQDIISLIICALTVVAYTFSVKRFMRQGCDYDTYHLKLLAARLKAALICFVPVGIIVWIIENLK